MDQTLEVRWFYSGSPPDSVIEWFMDLEPEKDSERTDLYLISDDPSLNVKLRESKIQLKRRSDAPETTSFHDRVRGYREPWQKWSFPLTDDAPDLFSDDPSGLWIPVTKTRHRREYTPDEQRALLPHLAEPNPATALVELTRVTSGEHEAWTICMEAEGQPEALQGTLQQMGRYVFQQGQPPALARSHSYGYVRWLKHAYERIEPSARDMA